MSEPATLRVAATSASDAHGATSPLERGARAVLQWALQTFPDDRFALVSAFGPGSAVLIHMLADVTPRLPVIFIDTLHHFPETLRHVEHVRRRYDLDLRVYSSAASVAEFERLHGTRLWERDLDRYQLLTKVAPFRRATQSLAGWITGRRRDQSATRAQLPPVEQGAQVRVNPLAAWTRADVWGFIRERDLPYNPLHDRGYASIGDSPLTLQVQSGEAERAGRWRGLDRLECGIHTQAE